MDKAEGTYGRKTEKRQQQRRHVKSGKYFNDVVQMTKKTCTERTKQEKINTHHIFI